MAAPIWILVANAAGARLYAAADLQVNHVASLGRFETRLLPGVPDDPREAEGWLAQELAAHLLVGWQRGAYEDLVLIAPPELLNRLRERMDGAVMLAVRASVAEDLTGSSEEEIAALARGRLAGV